MLFFPQDACKLPDWDIYVHRPTIVRACLLPEVGVGFDATGVGSVPPGYYVLNSPGTDRYWFVTAAELDEMYRPKIKR